MTLKDETRAAAVREAAAYLERITRKGLISQRAVLEDLEAVAERMQKGMTARGSTLPTEELVQPVCGASS